MQLKFDTYFSLDKYKGTRKQFWMTSARKGRHQEIILTFPNLINKQLITTCKFYRFGH